MATAPKTKKSKAPVAPENQTPSEAAAVRIVQRYGDLKPSVDRIMGAELDEDGRLRALELFETSLSMLNDPHRNPANAIEAARLAGQTS